VTPYYLVIWSSASQIIRRSTTNGCIAVNTMHTSSTTSSLPCAQAHWYKHVIFSSSSKLLYRHFCPIKSGDTLLPLTAIRTLRQNCRMYWASARSECDEKRIHNGIERNRRREILEEMGKRKKVQGRTKRGRDRYTWINREREREANEEGD